eukprot:scaffold203914_cov17-Tisochrysis_lutea.AAC.1
MSLNGCVGQLHSLQRKKVVGQTDFEGGKAWGPAQRVWLPDGELAGGMMNRPGALHNVSGFLMVSKPGG